jgi:hypothetical protein
MKKTMNFPVLSLLAVMLFYSCGRSTNTIFPYLVDVESGLKNVGSVAMSSLGKRISYIPLETDSVCLLQRISNLALTDSFIFVGDGTRLLKFSDDGKFLSKIGSEGRGPGQYINLSAIQADQKTRELYVLALRQMLVYDFNGNLKRTFKIDFPVRQFLLDNENNIVLHSINVPEAPTNEFSLYILDSSGNLVKKFKNDVVRVNKGMVVMTSPMYLYDGLIHFVEFGADTVHEYNNETRKPYAVFSLGNLKLQADPTMEEAPNIKGLWINDSKENDEYFFFSYWEGLSNPGKNCIYDKKTGKITVLNDNEFTNDLDGGLNFWPKRILEDYTMVDFEEAISVVNHIKEKQAAGEKVDNKLLDLLNRIDENSNPVLVFLK